uniref:Uncharacterized protein n=1 Tax=Anguilla anguilla TaxID=7936 RepID=A0A0E9RSD7_ANGAN
MGELHNGDDQTNPRRCERFYSPGKIPLKPPDELI